MRRRLACTITAALARALVHTQVVRAARAAELAAEKKQAHIEWLALHGMDGPRPCLYMGGRPVSYWTKRTCK